MTRFAVNVGFLYPELRYLERFAAVRADGFEAIESAWPVVGSEDFVAAVRGAGLRVALLNVAAGDLDAGERGHANDPTAVARWRLDFEAALRLAAAVDCPVLNVLAGNRVPDIDAELQLDCLRGNLEWALPRATREGRRLVVELLNPWDTSDYLVTDVAAAEALIAPLAGDGLRLQFDTYHVGRIEPDVPGTFTRLASLVAHVQIADVPGRHEPGTGTIPWVAFFDAIAASGYDGAVGLEYRPRADTATGLSWLPRPARAWSGEAFSPPR
jgi:hydroxypyruvate isomerase